MFDNYELDQGEIQEFTSASGDSEPQVTEPAESSPAPQQFKYTANGKEISEDIDTILQRASMGYNYAQHMNEFKQKQEAFAKEQESINQMRSKWEAYDKYATENPEWAEHVKNEWDNRLNRVEQTAQDVQNNTALPSELRNELEELKRFKSEYEADIRARKEQEEDSILSKQFNEISEQYPEYDLQHTDPKTGMTLEMQVLEHARVNGIHSVKAAFRDYMFEDLMAKGITKAKESTAKEIASRTQKGFLGESNDSMLQKDLSQSRSPRGMGYTDDILSGAQELGIL